MSRAALGWVWGSDDSLSDRLVRSAGGGVGLALVRANPNQEGPLSDRLVGVPSTGYFAKFAIKGDSVTGFWSAATLFFFGDPCGHLTVFISAQRSLVDAAGSAGKFWNAVLTKTLLGEWEGSLDPSHSSRAARCRPKPKTCD